MKRTVAGLTAALGGLLSAPALAADVLVYNAAVPASGSPVYSRQSMVTGDVALAIGYFDFGKHGDGAFGVANGRVNIPFAGAWNEELEVAGLADFVEDGYTAIGAFSHTYYKTPAAAAGILLGASSLDGDGALTAGVEAAVFMPSATVLGHVSYTWGDGSVEDFWTLNGEARWYWNPNTKLSGSVSWTDWDNAWMLTAAAEHLINATPISIFASASYFTSDSGDGWEVLGGARYAFGPIQSLQGHDWDVPFAAGRIISY